MGLRMSGLGFKVLGSLVQDVEFRVQGLGSGALDFRCRA